MKKQKCHKQESLILNGEGQKWKNSGEKKKKTDKKKKKSKFNVPSVFIMF